MSLLAFLAITLTAGSLSILLRRRRAASALLGSAGLVGGLVAGSLIGAGDAIGPATGGMVGSGFARLVVVLGCAAGLCLLLVSAATRWSPALPGAILLVLAAAAVALSATDAGTAVLAASAGGVVATLLALPAGGLERGLLVAGREVRSIAAAAALAVVGIALVAGPFAGAGRDGSPELAALPGIAFLAVAGAAAARMGAIPFHVRAARMADAAPEVGLPVVLAWGPAVFALVAISWTVTALPPGLELPLERALIGVVAAATIVLGLTAALLHDDLEHVVAYSTVADAGVLVLALAALDPAVSAPARTWLLAFVLARAAFAAWVAAAAGAFGTSRLTELAGWLRRSPSLAPALALVALASVGLPGMAAFAARRELVDAVVGGPLGAGLLGASLAAVAIYARILVAGIGRPSATVAMAPPVWPVWPALRRRRRRVLPGDAAEAWRRNRPPAAAIGALLLAGLAAAVASGGLGVRDAVTGPWPAEAAGTLRSAPAAAP